jgi:1-phosphofructokinase
VIVTLTPNPSLDRTLEVERLELGAVLRARDGRVEPGGKGINVALTLHVHGHETQVVMPCGGREGDHLSSLLEDVGIEPISVRIDGNVRTNVAIVDANGTVTKVNEPGPRLTDDEIEQLLDATVTDTGAAWVVGSGSLPPHAPVELFATLTRRAHDAGSLVAIDAEGAALSAAVDAGPDLVKPNREALAEVTGRKVTTIGEAIAAAQQLRERGVGAVLASLGEDGVVLVDDQGALHGYVSVRLSRSSVGAGNATLAGYLTAAGDRQRAIRAATAFGAAAASMPGSKPPAPADIRPDRVRVTDPPEQRRVLRSATPTVIGVPPRSTRKAPILP